jgi:Invasion associated locus B (IalB) protein
VAAVPQWRAPHPAARSPYREAIKILVACRFFLASSTGASTSPTRVRVRFHEPRSVSSILTRVIVDRQAPLTGPFVTCFTNGCMADYEATPDLIGKLKHGQMLTIQAINLAGSAISFPLPLVDFAKANEGPPTDPKVFAAQQKKLPDEMQKRADDARKKLKSQSTASASTR